MLCEYVESLIKVRSGDRFFLFVDEVQFTKAVKDEANGGIEVTIYDMLNELKTYKNHYYTDIGLRNARLN